MTRGARSSGLFALVAPVLLCTQIHAECAPRNLSIWPPPGPVPPNVMFLIEGDWLDVKLVESVKACDLLVVSDSERICLVPAEQYKGEYSASQVFLRPEHPLTSGKEYHLVASDEGSRPDQWKSDDRLGSPFESARWRVELSPDDSAPVWRQRPHVTRAEVREYGCGPAIGADVTIDALDATSILARTTVIGEDGGKSRTYLLPLDDSSVFIGHGMCTGGFELEPGEKYQATIVLVDAAGNAAESKAEVIEFTIPKRAQR